MLVVILMCILVLLHALLTATAAVETLERIAIVVSWSLYNGPSRSSGACLRPQSGSLLTVLLDRRIIEGLTKPHGVH